MGADDKIKVTGKAEELIGEATNNQDLIEKGQAKQAEGAVKEGVEKVKDAAKDAADAVKDAVSGVNGAAN